MPCDVQLHPQKQTIPTQSLQANVEFGVLESNGNCVNIGICRINTTQQRNMTVTRKENRRCPVATAFLSVTPHGRLQAFFPRAGMKACTERAFFHKPVFPVPVAYFLPESLQKELPGLKIQIIEEGLYPIRKTPEGFIVEF